MGTSTSYSTVYKPFAIWILFQLKAQHRLNAIKLDRIDGKNHMYANEHMKYTFIDDLKFDGRIRNHPIFKKQTVVVDRWMDFIWIHVHPCISVSLLASTIYTDDVWRAAHLREYVSRKSLTLIQFIRTNRHTHIDSKCGLKSIYYVLEVYSFDLFRYRMTTYENTLLPCPHCHVCEIHLKSMSKIKLRCEWIERRSE